MIKWRPEGFDSLKISEDAVRDWNASDVVERTRHISQALVEAGADAILDALRDQAKNNHLGSETRTGHWICISIPDEEG